ncbi:MAG TPA: PilT/PilU family type 4a pilus ATPase [Thermoanaerobaculia bacterium]|nr:PilT/PilU family type 4a pilus ATPase [Thermoanaerobaculia bacterium]
MPRLTRDEELEQLVRELNQGEPASTTGEPNAALEFGEADDGDPLQSLLGEMVGRGASDLLILAGAAPVFRVDGKIVQTERDPLDATDVETLFQRFIGERVRTQMAESGAADFTIRLPANAGAGRQKAHRFRVNLHQQRGTLAAALRGLPEEIPTFRELGLPPVLAELIKPSRGLVLVCGPTGSGKSTTLAAMVGEINRIDSRHIVTIEDPIEYEHRNERSIIEQVEVGRDAPSFAAALRASLRQDPDVILVGEMRDLETVATALTAAETGHLILSTLHTSDAAQAIHRIIDVFPPAQQSQIKHQLALSLNAIVCQQLIPRSDGGRVVAVEILLANYAIRNHIRQDRLQNLISEITLGKRHGMVSLEDSLAALVREGLISIEEARIRSSRPEELDSLMRRT